MFDKLDATDNFELTDTLPVKELSNVTSAGEFFAGFIEVLHDQLIKHDIEASEAGNMVSQIVCQMANAYAGETFYVSRKPLRVARQMAIYADSKTMKHHDVDIKYGVSYGYSRTIVKKIDEMRKHRQQLKLF